MPADFFVAGSFHPIKFENSFQAQVLPKASEIYKTIVFKKKMKRNQDLCSQCLLEIGEHDILNYPLFDRLK
jgi:hypothetical protein